MFEARYIYCEASHVPAAIPQLAELSLGVEILFENTDDLWPLLRWENLLDLADALSEAEIEVSVHGPFDNVNLGSRDSHIRRYAREVLTATAEFAQAVRSSHVVFHTGYLPQFPPSGRVRWLNGFSQGLDELLDSISGLDVRLAMENTYEPDLTLFEEIFARFPSPMLGMCFDTGHAACFGRIDPAAWSRRFADRICHVHLSDNDGQNDLHWGLGKGVVDFQSVLYPLQRAGVATGITLEVSADDALSSRDYLNNLLHTMSEQGQL